ncbi:PhoX family phosphatase [Cupriavidus sp. 2TAF22]|uniref:PhoX family protein n=1 Tax=unclassified Cupriavidus TaxID=2640874 RepID=UPI003F901025
MLDKPDASRRKALKLLAGAPMLPLGIGATALLVGCGGESDAVAAPAPAPTPATPASFTTAEFTGMAAPNLANPAAMATTTVGSSLKVSFSDGSSQVYKLAYQPFFITGDQVPDGNGGKILAGGYFDINNQPIIDKSVAGKERQFFSDAPDGTSLLKIDGAKVAGVKGNTVFAVVQFEYTTRNQLGTDTYGQLPSPIGVLTLDQDPATGKLTLVKYHNVDTSPANGLWITCGASLSPWNTHLSSEEYEPDAFTAAASAQFQKYSENLLGYAGALANPYFYGHLPEVTVNPDGTASIKKHYCLGRISHELVQVMPDNRTVLMGDDATNSGLFMFVADKEKDLSAGTLYVAKVGTGFSIDPAQPGADLTWVKLGHATSAEIEALAKSHRPTDIMDVSLTDPLLADPLNTGYTKIFTGGTANWIKIKPGKEKVAAFLETHRYAYLAGGSMGFTKMEGTTVNIKDKVAYSALQNIQDSMVKNNTAKGWNAQSNISVDVALKAGGVMQHKLAGGQKDLDGAAINSEWVPVHTQALIVGKDIAADALGNTADPETIANPDNLKFSEKLRTLFIGEDSGQHVNNFLWAYNVDTKKLNRVLSTPSGAESTGLHAVDEINGWTYVMNNFQHAGDWGGLHAKVQATLDPLVRANYKDRFGAAVGYLTADATSVKTAKA